jgi:predicted dehydrogenase/threonine dehydrogenase-like Zn-dependent dehydrogenase
LKQIIQNLKTGETRLVEVPSPKVRKGHLLIQTTKSLVSLGTEKMLVDFGRANYLDKARQQPEKVKQVFDKIKTDGLLPTVETVFNKLDQPLPLGYCNVGKVIAVGEGVSGFSIGDRVVSNGSHAEIVCVPQNLVARIPDNVSDEEAAFTVISSIGLQGIRLLQPNFGETVVVSGLGLIGLVTAELLLANGCNVIGFDFDSNKIDIANKKGIKAFNISEGFDSVKVAKQLTQGIGVDGVIITASTKSNELISQAAQMCRKRGRIVLVGVIGLDIKRSDFYEKELSFQVSCSYGPGRYDEKYEQHGVDYPLPFVRWTEKRNFESILFALSSGKLDVKPLITEVVDLEDFKQVYGDMGKVGSIASILSYAEHVNLSDTVSVSKKDFTPSDGIIGIVGAGNFTKMTILPTLKRLNAQVKYISSANGLNATALAKKYDIPDVTTDNQSIFNDKEVSLIFITTRHNSHATLTKAALKSGKHVFVEKPLALNEEELDAVVNAYEEAEGSLIVGFNRRFSPHVQKMKALLGNSQMNVIATMNAGFIPAESWVHDMKVGGGRIVGEACHFIDLITYLTGSVVTAVCMNAMGSSPEDHTDNASILLKYKNGSTGVINYFSNGSKAYSKERVEVYSQERTLVLDNFRKLEGYGFRGFSKMSTKLDKGHKGMYEQVISSVRKGGESVIPMAEIINTTRASFAAIDSLKQYKWIELDS